MIKAVIFDLDGTTVDSRSTWTESFKMAARKFGFDYSENLDHLTRGVGVIKAADKLTGHFGIPEKRKEFLNLAEDNYKNLFFQRVALMPGALDLLEKLSHNHKLALASSSPRFVLTANFSKFPKLKEYFKVSVAGDEVARTKPSPDIFLLAAQRLKEDPENCLVIEDSPTGVRAAKAAGMRCIGLLDPGPKKQAIEAADRQVDSLTQISEKLIEQL